MGVVSEKGAWHLLLVQDDSQLDPSGAEAMGGLWIEWESLPRSCRQQDGSPPGLRDSVLSCLEHSKCTLTHTHRERERVEFMNIHEARLYNSTWYPILTRQRRASLSTILLLKETKFLTFSSRKNLGR